MKKAPLDELGRRERQIMGILYERGHASASEVLRALPDPPSYSAVRAMLKLLEDKGHAQHVSDGSRHVYSPTMPARQASKSALDDVVKTFFRGSREAAMAALLEHSKRPIPDEHLRRIAKLIKDAQKD